MEIFELVSVDHVPYVPFQLKGAMIAFLLSLAIWVCDAKKSSDRSSVPSSDEYATPPKRGKYCVQSELNIGRWRSRIKACSSDHRCLSYLLATGGANRALGMASQFRAAR